MLSVGQSPRSVGEILRSDGVVWVGDGEKSLCVGKTRCTIGELVRSRLPVGHIARPEKIC